ncbi:MAG: thioredoxin domain-containing protein [Ferruginibacter sp.]
MNLTRKWNTMIALLFCTCGYAQTGNSLEANEFERAINNKDSVQVLDVRTPQEYSSGHIVDALLADWKDETEFTRRIAFIDKDKPVYVYCLAGGRSAAAAQKMRTMGFTNVYELHGGINAWKASNKFLEGRKPNEKQMSISDLEASINSSKIVLVDFGAVWCPPCKKMEPVLKKLLQDFPGKITLVKVDAEKDEEILKKYNVTALPVFILYKNGKQIWRREGTATESEFAGLIN